jgi:hypothetical protein
MSLRQLVDQATIDGNDLRDMFIDDDDVVTIDDSDDDLEENPDDEE